MISVLGGSHFWNLELADKGRHKFSSLTHGSQSQSSLPRKEERKHWIKRKQKERSREEAVKEKAERAAAGREGKLNQQNGFGGQQTKISVLGRSSLLEPGTGR